MFQINNNFKIAKMTKMGAKRGNAPDAHPFCKYQSPDGAKRKAYIAGRAVPGLSGSQKQDRSAVGNNRRAASGKWASVAWFALGRLLK